MQPMRSAARSRPSFAGHEQLLAELQGANDHDALPLAGDGRRDGVAKYDFIARLGSGGMGDVFLAVTHGPNHFRKLCVVKQLRTSVASTARSRQTFSKEGYLAARLNHPNIVQTYEVGEDDGVPYLAMEYLEGQTMRTLFSATRSTAVLPDFALWVRIVADALAGLHHVHEVRDFDGSPLGVIHRDVSPHNIFVTYEGRVCLIDFGAAKLALKRQSVECRTLTGKLGYMAPEYVTGGHIDRRADIFSMGVVLWEALAGKKMPNAGLTPAECCRARPRVSSIERRVDPKLDAIVAKAVDVDPERRYADAEEMREALEDWLQSSGRAPRQGDLGDLVTAYFEEEREKVEAAIRARVEAVPTVHLMGAPSDANVSDVDESASDGEDDDGWARKSGEQDVTAQAGRPRTPDSAFPIASVPSVQRNSTPPSRRASKATRRTLSLWPAMAVVAAAVAVSVTIATVAGYMDKIPW